MRRTNSVGAASRAALFTALVAAVALTPSAPAQGQGGLFIPAADQNTELFRGLFHFHGITPVSITDAKSDYRNLIVVVLGNPQNVEIARITKTTLANGGAVLIANVALMDLSGYLPSGGPASITSVLVSFRNPPAPGVAAATTRGVIVPVQPGVFDQARGGLQMPAPEVELFTPFPRVEVKVASYLKNDAFPPELARNVAEFPPNAEVPGLVPKPRKLVFAAAGVGTRRDNPFRCVAMASETVFWNQMLYTSGRLEDPTDNLKFANTLVQWLKGPEGRTRCLFVENGTVMTEFDKVKYASIPLGPPIPPVPMPPILDFFQRLMQRDVEAQQRLTDMGNTAVRQAEDDDMLGKFLASTNERKAGTYLVLAVLAAFVLYALVRYRTLAARFQALFRPVPKDPLRLGPDTVVGSVEHRRLEILRAGNYGVPVRSYIRQLFEERGLPPGYAGEWPPRFRYNLRNRDFVRQALTTLWAELTSDKPINYSRWKELEPLLAAARAAADDDRWWIEIPSDEGRA